MFTDILNSTKHADVSRALDVIIADKISNRKNLANRAELFTRGRKLNISTAVITQSYLQVTKVVRLNCTHLFIMKIVLQKCIAKPDSSIVINITIRYSSS